MVEGNKILTVSYGTFSCTLEGFEDSFSTMKAIAEYFRDLAADDRYFGAEPPTPDAAMLARIAEREVSRHVEASVDGNDVLLRAAPDEVPALEANTAQPSKPSKADKKAKAAKASKKRAEKAAAKKAKKAVKAKKKAAKPRLAVLANPDQSSGRTVEDAMPSAFIDGTDAETSTDALHAVDLAPSADLDIHLPEQSEDAFDIEAEVELDTSAVTSPEPVLEAEADDAVDSVAAKLARIRSVVTPSGDTSEGDAYSEDQHATDTVFAPSETSQAASADTSDMANVLAAMADDDIQADASVAIETPAQIDTTAEGNTDNDASILDALATLNLGEGERVDAPIEVEAQEPEPQEAKPFARVVKVKRSDFEAALTEGGLEEVDDSEDVDYDPQILTKDIQNEDDVVDDVANALGQTSLSDEDEAELMAELAAVEREVKSTEVDAIEEVNVDAATPETADEDIDLSSVIEDASDDENVDRAFEVQDAAQRLDPAGDADETVDRLMTKTQDEFDQPETGRRRNAIAHLKAAVAATRAERGAAGDIEPDADETDDYRDDLAQVVRPRRAQATGRRSERPTAKIPPLTLVAEQRVDLDTQAPKPTEAAPVRPRRVAKVKSRLSDDDLGSFQEFADAQGAHELPDLLEAAAAYAAYIKGQPNFTRPELMSKVMKLSDDGTHSREDSLRSFGQLLREGKIVKVKKGQFAVSEETRFRPDNVRFAGE